MIRQSMSVIVIVSKLPYEHPGTLIPRIAYRHFSSFDSLLDVGSGEGLIGEGVWKVPHIASLDIFPPKNPGRNFTLGNALYAVQIYGAKSFDVVQCGEMIEHMTKEDGLRLLPVLEEVARKFVIITTPEGFTDQDPEKFPDEPWRDNPYQKHLSGFSVEDFTERGYTCMINGVEERVPQIIAWKVVQQ